MCRSQEFRRCARKPFPHQKVRRGRKADRLGADDGYRQSAHRAHAFSLMPAIAAIMTPDMIPRWDWLIMGLTKPVAEIQLERKERTARIESRVLCRCSIQLRRILGL
jgi:hypothetical protein